MTATKKPAAEDRRRIPVPTPILEPAPGEERRYFWVGALPELPHEFYDMAGIGFPKQTELVRRVDSVGRTERIRCRGHVLALTASQLERLAERLGRTIVRPAPFAEETGAGVVLDRDVGRRPWGRVVTSPSAEMIEATKNRTRPMRPVEPRHGDRAVAEFLYLVPVENNKPHFFDTELPKPIAETGLEFSGGLVA
jgi:hypothetical protein